jgi:CheY-like chemotaxis protein
MRRTILLADDSPTIQRLVGQTFADGNYDVIAVSNGEAAIKRFEESQPDVVLADIYMPGRSGYEVCAYVRAHATLGATPVILLVGAFDAFDEATATQAGASASITKPFEPRALIEMVQSALANAPVRERPEKKAEPAAKPVSDAVVVAPAITQAPPPSAPVPAPPSASVTPAPTLSLAAVAPALPSAAPAPKPASATPAPESDILGLSAIFPTDSPRSASEIGDSEIERIAERVMKKLSSQAVQQVAWDVIPEIAEMVIRESLKKPE